MTPERLFNSFIPQKLLYPKKQISGYVPDLEQATAEQLHWRDANTISC